MDKKNKGFWADNAAAGGASMIDSAAELKKKQEQFEAELADYLAITPTFWQLAKVMVERRGWNSSVFKDRTLLSDMIFSRIINDSKIPPSIRTATAICVGFGLDVQTSEKLLASAGHTFGTSKEHKAYHFLLTEFKGHSIDECNHFLSSIGVEALGVRARAA